jgi:hypothetical protein
MIPGDADPYFAFQMPFFWSHLIVNLRDIWNVEGLQGIIDTKYKTTSFPYTEREVIWAFNHFSDAYGPVLKKGQSVFKKCSCVKDGRRYPCIPPKMDFMCKRVCTLIKMQLVFQEDRSNRLWIEYKKNNLNDAIKRAKNEAETYLVSKAGKEWLAAEAAEQADTILTGVHIFNFLWVHYFIYSIVRLLYYICILRYCHICWLVWFVFFVCSDHDFC